MTVDRTDVVAAARSWMGTPFAHQHRVKGLAVDCAGLVIGVAREVGIVAPDFDVNGYARSPDGRSLLETCDRWMKRIALSTMRPGDVLVIRWDLNPQHLGIVGDYPYAGQLSIIHALGNVDGKGSVREHRLAPVILRRAVQAYAMPGVV